MKKNKLLSVLLLAILITGCSAQADTDEDKAKEKQAIKNFPNKTIEVVIPFGEGSASDTFVRQYSKILSEHSNANFQPVNKDGSGGLLGMLYSYQQNNDGYNILEVTPSQVISDTLDKSEDIKLLDEFEPLAQIQNDIYVISVAQDSPIKSYEDLVEKSKKGKVTVGGVSSTGLDDFATSQFSNEAKINTEFIPYSSGSEVKAAALGGEVDVYLDKVVNVVDYAQSKKVRPIIVFNDKRIDKIKAFENVPSTKEKGLDVDIGSWRGFVVKKGTPKAVKDKLAKQLKDAYETDEYKKYEAMNLVDSESSYLDADEFDKKMKSEYKKFNQIAKELEIK
ncbi:tripartite tricarboxylate transporter substrate binding protein [Mammaliicoccus sp. Dog046]|uniref:Bug family tripartite tricarboxylate transporter substrate binding protein n=1 Tax=Mammaliicoccus sp. Dog046 TaxID=3034233 RepID=UPI002B2588B0|nr:tripartite tricarboxylate transporter substrate binding protein [Mammaliicoccus sp. Dog046]WQK85607.1 tripartite tricarboxylate transporter substrate binding protein [Mammaliicoccus sp. Dog046]